MVKAIIFDCFGVVVGKGIWHIYDLAGGDSVRDAEYLDEVLFRANSGQISSVEFHKAITKKLSIGVDEWKDLAAREEKPNIELIEYIRDKLKPRYKIGFLSNVNHGVIDRKLPKEWQALFDDMVISAEVGMVKPEPEIFKLAANRLGIRPEECVFTDDIQKYLKGAESVGMKAILYEDFNSFKAELEEYCE